MSKGSISLSTILGIIFVILKLCGVITWPWIWVLAPFWIGFIVTIILAIIFAAITH